MELNSTAAAGISITMPPSTAASAASVSSTNKRRPHHDSLSALLGPVLWDTHRHAAEASLSHRLISILYSLALIALATAIGLLIQQALGTQNVLLVFLPVILLTAVKFGFWTASWVSVASVLSASYFFAAPRLSFAVSEPANVWALAVFLISSALTSSVAAQARQRAEAVGYHNRILEQLYEFSSRLASASRHEDLAREIVIHAETLLRADIVLLEQAEDVVGSELAITASAPPGIALNGTELANARDASRSTGPTANDGRPGAAAPTDFAPQWQFRPIRAGESRTAVLGVRPHSQDRRSFQADKRLLDLLIDQIEVNLERIQLTEEMQRAEMRAATEKLKSALFTSISHDLRTPLASILGNVTSVRSFGQLYDDETRSEMLEQAETETLRLSRFVDNLLQMTRIEAGAVKPVLEQLDLGDVIGSALNRMEKSLSGHSLRVQVDEPVPMLMLDFVLTEQVIANLLDNAAKFSAAGTSIEISAAASAESVELCVRDQGPGISPDDATRVFERFFRVESADHRPAGTGLGLAICKGFVEAMGGEISVRNRVSEKGSEFLVRFPLRKDARAPA